MFKFRADQNRHMFSNSLNSTTRLMSVGIATVASLWATVEGPAIAATPSGVVTSAAIAPRSAILSSPHLHLASHSEAREAPALAAPQARDLTDEEMQWARAAWSYFTEQARNLAPPPPPGAAQPGAAAVPEQRPLPRPAVPINVLVPARSGVPYATMWSIGDQVAALVLARKLEIIEEREFDRRFSAILGFLNGMPLAFDRLPNRTYHVETGAPLNAAFEPGMAGWSSIDIGRLLIWLRIAAVEFP
ncbi:MAG TPA: DUF3131 domain-containing protein, partial [Thermoanaerobaculia bacterium]|nr:DUF3131 domain-containing protein [Thermoanaerobaculia bacterium]